MWNSDVTYLASLPMYDLPEVKNETDALWSLFASHMRKAGVTGVPDRLNRTQPNEAAWSHPDLLITQTCGYPLMTRYQRILRPLGTPQYGVEGCSGADYSSVVLVASGSGIHDIAQLRSKVCAVNSLHSHSGYNALRGLIAPLSREGRFFSEVKVTGSHRMSIHAVVAGDANACAVDCVTFALLARYTPETIDGTRVLELTDRCPGLPMVVRRNLEDDQFSRLRTALRRAMADPAGADIRAALFIEGMIETDIEDYRPILAMEMRAGELGYRELT